MLLCSTFVSILVVALALPQSQQENTEALAETVKEAQIPQEALHLDRPDLTEDLSSLSPDESLPVDLGLDESFKVKDVEAPYVLPFDQGVLRGEENVLLNREERALHERRQSGRSFRRGRRRRRRRSFRYGANASR